MDKMEDKKDRKQYFKKGIETIQSNLHAAEFHHLRTKSLDTLRTLLKNIHKHPEDEKYRDISGDNANIKSLVLEVEGALVFLRGVGFKLNRETNRLVCPKSPTLIDDVAKALRVLQTKYHESLNNFERYEEALRILKKNKKSPEFEDLVFTIVNIANNVWRNPNVEKFRDLSLEKPKIKAIYDLRGGQLCLTSIGFKIDKKNQRLFMDEKDFDANICRKLVDNLKDVCIE